MVATGSGDQSAYLIKATVCGNKRSACADEAATGYKMHLIIEQSGEVHASSCPLRPRLLDLLPMREPQ